MPVYISQISSECIQCGGDIFRLVYCHDFFDEPDLQSLLGGESCEIVVVIQEEFHDLVYIPWLALWYAWLGLGSWWLFLQAPLSEDIETVLMRLLLQGTALLWSDLDPLANSFESSLCQFQRLHRGVGDSVDGVEAGL